jgi:hypothetical protein
MTRSLIAKPERLIACAVAGFVLLIIFIGFIPKTPSYLIREEAFFATGSNNRNYRVIVAKSTSEVSNALPWIAESGRRIGEMVSQVNYASEFVVVSENARLRRIVEPRWQTKYGIMEQVNSNGVFLTVVRGKSPELIKFVSGNLPDGPN